MPFQTTTSNTVLFLLLILAFFPSLFIGILKLPFKPLLPASPSRPPVPATAPAMSWFQKTISLPSKSRGSYLVTDEVLSALPELKQYRVGLLNLFVQHTSCALSLNENWDEDVRADMSDALDRIAPEDRKGGLYRHAAEGRDDMPVRTTPRLSAWTCWLLGGRLGEEADEGAGTHQERADRRERHDSDQQREAGDGDVAGDLVSGVSVGEALAQGRCDHPGREGVTAECGGGPIVSVTVFSGEATRELHPSAYHYNRIYTARSLTRSGQRPSAPTLHRVRMADGSGVRMAQAVPAGWPATLCRDASSLA